MLVYAPVTDKTPEGIINTIARAINADLINDIDIDEESLDFGIIMVRLDISLPEYPDYAEKAIRDYIYSSIIESDRKRAFLKCNHSETLTEVYFKWWLDAHKETQYRLRALKTCLGN